MPFCIYCGGANEPGYKFCIHCGKPSADAPQPPVTPSPQQLAVPPQQTTAPSLHPEAPHLPFTPLPPQPPTVQQPAAPPFDSGQWYAKNKTWLLPVLAVLVIGIVIYQFFLKPNPAKEGKALAAKECGCTEAKAAEEVRLKNEFLAKFDSYAFAGADAAQQRLNEIEATVNQSADSCLQAGREAARSNAEKFKNPDDQGRFMQAYSDAKQQCNASSSALADADAKTAGRVEAFRQQLQQQSETERKNKQQQISDSTAAVNAPATEAPPATAGASPPPTEAPMADVISRFYAAENAVQSAGDIEPLLRYYAFPLARYYDAYSVDRSRMAKIYSDSYFTSLARHRVYGFENNIQTEAMPNGDTKVTVGCQFEFSTQKSPDDVRTRASTNVYVLSPAGKIKSVYQLK